MIEWRDADGCHCKPEPVIPMSWEARVGAFRLLVWRHIRDANAWFMVGGHATSTIELAAKNVDEAKREAVEAFHAALRAAIDEIEGIHAQESAEQQSQEPPGNPRVSEIDQLR